VSIELVVNQSSGDDPEGRWTDVLLWSEEKDPRLLDSQRFTDPGAFRNWLNNVVATYGRENIRVRWTDALTAKRTLARLIAVCLALPVPPEPEP
jgi:hypothetical protein